MLIEKTFNTIDDIIYMELRNIKKEVIPWVEQLAAEYKCKVEKREWKSKYNHYVVYDYEPFCSEGFEITLTLSSRHAQFLNFVKYLYELKMQMIKHLDNCLQI